MVTHRNIVKGVIGTILFLMVFIMTDCSCGRVDTERGTVVDKRFVPARTTMETVTVGETTTMQPRHHPAEYHVMIEVTGGEVRRMVTRNEYNNIQIGDDYRVRYRIGKFTGIYY